MPRHTPHHLQWSEQAQAYEVASGVLSIPQQLVPDTAALRLWLDSVSSFAFQSRSGEYCTMRKETIGKRGAYWYGYRSIQQRTVKHYAGRTGDLSIARLEKLVERFTVITSDPPDGEVRESVSSTTTPLLATKLHPPRLPLGLVERPRLLIRLDAYRSHKLTLLSAPAGFGKSTLVNHWRAERRDSTDVSWISLDSHDNDPIHFWHTVLTASNIWYPTFDESILPMLLTAGTPSLAPSTLEAALTAFLNQVDRQSLTGLLILDNYHTITETSIHETLSFFLTNLPDTLHIILITRTEPAIPLARLRANGELNEIQASDLRFTPQESATFLDRTVEYDLAPEMLERIEAQVEGWAAGLRLLALSLRGKTTQTEVEQVLAAFHGKHRPIKDYFVAEVLRAQPESLQDFLLRTSILKRFNASLCCAITGRLDSAELLETIERSNLFLESLDSTGEWYHYQTLFAEAMQHEAHQRLGEQELSSLSHLASCWFEEHGLLSEAIEAALKAGESTRTADLLEHYVEKMQILEFTEHHTIRRWLERLPEALLKQRPQLCLAYAIALIFDGTSQQTSPPNFGQITELLDRADEQWQTCNHSVGIGKVFAFRAFLNYRRGMRVQSLAWAREALVYLPETEPIWRGLSLSTLGMDSLQMGELNQAQQIFQEIKDLWQEKISIHILDGITLLLGIISFEQGKLHQTSQHLHKLHREAELHQNQSVEAITSLLLAQISYEWNNLELAEQQIQDTFHEQAQQAAIPPEFFQIPIELTLARIRYAHGEREPAIQRLEALLTYPPIEGPFIYLNQEILNWLIRSALSTQDYAAAQDKFDTFLRHQAPEISHETRLLAAPGEVMASELSQPETSVTIHRNGENNVIFQEQRALIMARLSIARGETEAALLTLKQLLPAARTAGRGHITLQMLLLSAQAYAIRRQLAEARQILLEALTLGSIEGYQRTILDEGEPLSQLLRDLLPQLSNQPLHSYVTKLLRAFAHTQTSQSTIVTPVTSSFYEPLSPQEQRVLRLLASGNSNAEIAKELVVSINTIRTQVQSIYHKLQVNNRHAASQLARSLHLL
jgi:LuxR family transcriptional regulator, maltose regulon positive regulatory protein